MTTLSGRIPAEHLPTHDDRHAVTGDLPPMTVNNIPPPPTAGPATPLTAAYCAERAALALHAAAQELPDQANTCLRAAEQWRHLAELLATNPAANRPRDDDDGDRRRGR